MNALKTTLHRTGTITFWSVYDQTWHRHTRFITDQDLAAMASSERCAVLRHLGFLDNSWLREQQEAGR